MPLNLHIIRTCYPHWGEYSGFHRFVGYLNPGKYRVTLHEVPDSNADFPIRNRILQRAVLKVIQRGKMKWYKLSDLTAELRLLRHSLCSNPPDIIHYLDGEHSARYFPAWRKAFSLTRPRIVVTFHQPPGIIDDLVDWKIFDRVHSVSVVSPDQAEYLGRFMDSGRIRTILMGIDVDFFRPATERHFSDRFVCLTAGHYLRDFDLLRRICEGLSHREDILFDVVGSRCEALHGLPNVRLHEGISDQALRGLYREADLLLLPMLRATANNALLEGIACGLPVVATLLPGLRAYVPGEEALLVEGHSPDGYIQAILNLLEDPGRRERMAIAARTRALQLDWRKVTPLFEAMYDGLAPPV